MKGYRRIKSGVFTCMMIVLTLVIIFFVKLWWDMNSQGHALPQPANSPLPSSSQFSTPLPLQSSTPSPSRTTPAISSATEVSELETNASPYNTTAKRILSEMTLHEKLCQLFIVYPETITGAQNVTATGEMTEQALKEYPVGGFIYDSSNMVSSDQVRSMLSGVQSYSKIPLILTCDEEGGRVSRLMNTVGTTRIGPMLDYENEGTQTAYNNAFTIASDLHSLGFNVDLAPVADVWSNPENTVIGDRAYSTNFQLASELIPHAVAGFQAGGVACTLKHFPGHGDTLADSHEEAVYVTKSLEEIRQNELLPFKSGIQAGTDCVMIGHIIISDVENVPAPFSAEIVGGLLREEMGFQGVVMTDGLQMNAIKEYYSSDNIAILAIQAGVDVLLGPDDLKTSVHALTDAVNTGTVTEDRIDESVLRILEMKLRRDIIPQG